MIPVYEPNYELAFSAIAVGTVAAVVATAAAARAATIALLPLLLLKEVYENLPINSEGGTF